MANDKILQLKKELELEQKKVLLKNYDIQILELQDKIDFTEEAKKKLQEEIANLGG